MVWSTYGDKGPEDAKAWLYGKIQIAYSYRVTLHWALVPGRAKWTEFGIIEMFPVIWF